MQVAAVLEQSQPVVAVAERPLSRKEEMTLKAMSLEEVCISRLSKKYLPTKQGFRLGMRTQGPQL